METLKKGYARKNRDFLPNGCPVTYCNNILGGKWKPIIIHYIRKGSNRYSLLQRALTEVSRQTLTNQLRELEEDGIIDRKVFAEIPPRVEYSISAFGKTMMPIIDLMMEWGTKQMRVKKAGGRQQAAGRKTKPPER